MKNFIASKKKFTNLIFKKSIYSYLIYIILENKNLE